MVGSRAEEGRGMGPSAQEALTQEGWGLGQVEAESGVWGRQSLRKVGFRIRRVNRQGPSLMWKHLDRTLGAWLSWVIPVRQGTGRGESMLWNSHRPKSKGASILRCSYMTLDKLLNSPEPCFCVCEKRHSNFCLPELLKANNEYENTDK